MTAQAPPQAPTSDSRALLSMYHATMCQPRQTADAAIVELDEAYVDFSETEELELLQEIDEIQERHADILTTDEW